MASWVDHHAPSRAHTASLAVGSVQEAAERLAERGQRLSEA